MFVWLPPGLIMSLNVQFMFFLGTKLCERRFGYLQEDVFIETFGISKLFRTKNYFDVSLKQTCFEKFKRISWIGLHKCWIILFCFWCEVMFCWSKRFKLQFDGYKELIFNLTVTKNWSSICLGVINHWGFYFSLFPLVLFGHF
jgi:hypothetical protein